MTAVRSGYALCGRAKIWAWRLPGSNDAHAISSDTNPSAKAMDRLDPAARVLVGEARCPKDAVCPVQHPQRVGAAGAIYMERRHHGRVAEEHASKRQRQAPERLSPATVGLGQVDLAHDGVDDLGQELALVGEVGVGRHRCGAQFGRQAPHRERVEALGVDDRERCPGDPLAAQRVTRIEGRSHAPYIVRYGVRRGHSCYRRGR
jgi:hypothetical protein